MGLSGTRLFDLSHQRARLLQQGVHLHHVHAGNRPHFEASGEDAQGFFAADDGLARQCEALVQFQQPEIGIRHLGDQAYRDGMARRIRGKVGFQRRLLEIAHPPPEIEFPGGQPHNDLVLVGGQRSTCRAEVARHTCPAAIDAGCNGRKLVGPLDAIGRLRFGHAQHGGPQISVMRQRLGDQGLELRIGKVVTPGDFRREATCGCQTGRLPGIRRVRRRDRQRRSLVRRGERAAGHCQNACQHAQGNDAGLLVVSWHAAACPVGAFLHVLILIHQRTIEKPIRTCVPRSRL